MSADPITRLTVELQGATDAELHRGLEAALGVFKSAGVTPLQAARAVHTLEGDMTRAAPGNRPPRGTKRTAAVWDAAAIAATLACTQSRATLPNVRATLNLEYAADDTDD